MTLAFPTNAGQPADTGKQSSFESCKDRYIASASATGKNELLAAAADGSVWILEQGTTWAKLGESLPDCPKTKDYTAIHCDPSGRIWIGTVDRGVYVYVETKWKQYSVLNGPASSRIYQIASSNKSGRVAIAHACGVSVWSPADDRWQDISTLKGLPQGAARSVAFGDKDVLYVAMEWGGFAKCLLNASGNYVVTTVSRAKWFFDSKSKSHVPLSKGGPGLPTNQTNAVAYSEDLHQIYLGTSAGLAWTSDDSVSFQHTRGTDYKKKIQGLYPSGGVEEKTLSLADLLPEDHILSLKSVPEGLLIGFRSKGAILWDPSKQKIKQVLLEKGRVTAFVDCNGTLYASTFGDGIVELNLKRRNMVADGKKPKDVKSVPASFPADARPADKEALGRILEKFDGAAHLPANRPWAVFLHDDWETKGDWCERYGRIYGRLCGVRTPAVWMSGYSFEYAISGREYDSFGYIGPMKKKDDTARYWIQWHRRDENRNVLFVPDGGIRTEAEWDDHGETYDRSIDGPDLWVPVSLPQTGPHTVSLYFFSPNGRDGANEFERDYLIEIYPYQGAVREEPDIGQVMKGSPLACSRVSLFTNGVYKVFALNGNHDYIIRISRNYSFNTILNGIFISKMNEEDCTRAERLEKTRFMYMDCFPTRPRYTTIDLQTIPSDSLKLWRLAQCVEPSSETLRNRRMLNLYSLRAAKTSEMTDPDYITLLHWFVPVFSDEAHEEFTENAKRMWEEKQKVNELTTLKSWYPHSPNVH